MEIKKTKSSKLPVVIALAVVIVAAAGYLSYAYLDHLWPYGTQSTSKESGANQNSSDNSAPKVDDAPDIPTTSDNSQDKTPAKYDDPSSSSNDSATEPDKLTVTGTINYSSVSNGKLMLRVTIDQHLASGTCTLSLVNTSSSKTVSRTANIVDNPSSATCQGFDISTSELGSGDWSIDIKITSGNQIGTIKGQVKI